MRSINLRKIKCHQHVPLAAHGRSCLSILFLPKRRAIGGFPYRSVSQLIRAYRIWMRESLRWRWNLHTLCELNFVLGGISVLRYRNWIHRNRFRRPNQHRMCGTPSRDVSIYFEDMRENLLRKLLVEFMWNSHQQELRADWSCRSMRLRAVKCIKYENGTFSLHSPTTPKKSIAHLHNKVRTCRGDNNRAANEN